MDLMKLVAKLSLDDTGYTRGLEEAERQGSQFGQRLSSMTVAVGQVMASLAMKAVGEIKKIVTGAIGGYADYEQLIGGVETLFKTSSKKVEEYAKRAYKTAGMSANQYMETVTSFSASLLQGLAGDTEQAAEIADMAIQDMSDNANKMGTDIQSIMAAYQGFAKQNFTMLDNLKLGYGGTASEMIRLINESHILDHEISSLDGITLDQIMMAIHAIQEQMGITGTTAEEAGKTISGSFAAMKAAFADLMASIGGGDQGQLNAAIQNFKDQFSTYVGNLIPVIADIIGNSGTLVGAIAESIASLPETLLGDIGGKALEGGTELANSLSHLADWIINSISNFFNEMATNPQKVQQFGEAIGFFIGHTVSMLIDHLPGLVEGLTRFGLSLAVHIIDGIVEGLFGSTHQRDIDNIKKQLSNEIAEVEISSSRAEAILTYMQRLREKYGEAVQSTKQWSVAQDELEKVLKGSKQTFIDFGSDIDGAIKHLQGMVEELRSLAIENALNKALSQLLEIEGELQADRIMQEYNIQQAESNQEAIARKQIESARAYARAVIASGDYKEGVDTTGRLAAAQAVLDKGEKLTGAEAYDALHTYLIPAMTLHYSGRNTPEEEKIWNLNPEDYIVDPETIERLDLEYDDLARIIRESNEKIRDIDKQIEQLQPSIDEAEGSLRYFAEKMLEAGAAADGFASMLKIGGNSNAPKNVARGFSWGDFSSPYMPRAVGLDYVPYDGFRAELHRGEAIITKEENAARGAMDYAAVGNMIGIAIEDAMGKMYIAMSGERVGDLTTKQVRHNINAGTYSRMRSMGG